MDDDPKEKFGIDKDSPYPYTRIEAEACSARRLAKNFYKRMFNMYGTYIRVTKMISNFESGDNHEIYMQTL